MNMTSLERTINFIENRKVDRPPFHPIIMRFAAKYSNAKYKDFCLDYRVKTKAMLKCAKDFSIDWLTVMSDPYAEAEAYGVKFEYPENNLPEPIEPLFTDVADINRIGKINALENPRMVNRINEIKEYVNLTGNEYFIVGWVEGPMAEYADIRGFGDACIDLFDAPEKIAEASEIMTENAIDFITHQVKAGAHCIGIGEAACSQIGPALYKELFFEKDKALVDHIHSLGAYAKLHICGNTSSILPDMIKTGADIVDIDHLVGSMRPFANLLGEKQVFSGSSDPVSVIQDGDAKSIEESVVACYDETNGRCIVSAGCEVTPGTSIDNFRAYENSILKLKR